MSKEETELVNARAPFIDNLAEYLDENVSGKAKAKQGVEFRKELEHVLETENISLLAESFSDVVEEIRTYKKVFEKHKAKNKSKKCKTNKCNCS